MSIAMSIFSLLGTLIIGFSMLPQTLLTLRNKQTASLSVLLYLMMTLATLLLTIYGIGLVIIPDPAANINANELQRLCVQVGSLDGLANYNDQWFALAQKIGAGSFTFASPTVANGFDFNPWINAVRQNWISGFLVPGIALIIGELICCVSSGIITFIKIKNKLGAKKAGMSEQAYILKKYGNIPAPVTHVYHLKLIPKIKQHIQNRKSGKTYAR